MFHRANGQVLVAVGLLGIGGYELIVRPLHLRLLSNDFAHGLWLGASIGFELLGLFLLGKNRRRHAA